MAIVKLVSASTPNPLTAGAGGDWELAMAQLTACKQVISGQQMVLTNWTNTDSACDLADGSYFQHLGSIYVADADVSLSGFVAGANYVRLEVSGDTLVATLITSLTGYEWNHVYNGFYNGNYQVLPYMIDYVPSHGIYRKYRLLNINSTLYVDYLGNTVTAGTLTVTGAIQGASLSVAGAIAGATVNTGQGANELYAMNQNVRTTDSPTFADLVVPDNFLVAGNTNYHGVESGVFASTVTVPCSGSFRCVSTIASTYFSPSVYGYMSMVVYKNASEVYRYDSTTQETVTKSYDVTFSTGDTIKLYVYIRAQVGGGSASASNTYFRTNKSKLVSSLYHNMFVFTDES